MKLFIKHRIKFQKNFRKNYLKLLKKLNPRKTSKKKPKIVSEIEENHVSEVSDAEQIEPKEQEISSDLSLDSSPEPDVQAPTENLHADQSSDMNPTEEE